MTHTVKGKPMDRQILHHMDGNPRNNTPENLRVMNIATNTRLPSPSKSLAVMESILSGLLDTIARTETEIDDLCADLRDADNDYREGTVTLQLTAARERQRLDIRRAGESLRTIEALRRMGGVESSVLARVFSAYSGEQK